MKKNTTSTFNHTGNYICECGKEFTNSQAYNGHKSMCIMHRHYTNREDYNTQLSQEASLKRVTNINKTKRLKAEQRLDQGVSEKHKCEHCGKIMTERFGSGRFCCRSCANARKLSEKSKKQISEKVKNNPKCIECLKRGYNNSPVVMSKGEINLRKRLKQNFPEANFTNGVIKKYKGISLSPDIWSKKLKIIIEYDGIWHFKDIHGQLKDKQYKDRLLVQFALENDYRLIRIDENYKWSYDDIVNLIFNCNSKIILLGDRYDYLLDLVIK